MYFYQNQFVMFSRATKWKFAGGIIVGSMANYMQGYILVEVFFKTRIQKKLDC